MSNHNDDGLDLPTYRPAGQPEETTAFPRPKAAPQEIYADQDFAPSKETVSLNASPAATSATTPATTNVSAASFAPVGEQPVHEVAPVVTTEAQVPDYRRGTLDLGVLLVRLLLGLWLIQESVGTFFQLGGSTGLAGLEAEYSAYVVPTILAIVVPALQLAAGVFLVLGLITPLFAACATIVTVFSALHALTGSGAGLNLFAWSEGVWLSLILLGMSVALQFSGPGLYSLDAGRSWARRPLASSWIFILLAAAGAVALWWFGAGVNPLS